MAIPSFTVEAWSTQGSILTDFLFTPPRAFECPRGGTRTSDLQVTKVERSPLDHTGNNIHIYTYILYIYIIGPGLWRFNHTISFRAYNATYDDVIYIYIYIYMYIYINIYIYT